MRRAASLLAIVLVAAAPAAAQAQSFIGRRLTVAPSQLQLYGAWDFLRPCDGCADDEFVDLGLDVGLSRDTQIGVMGSFGVSPGDWLETGIVDWMRQLSRSWALRADLGVQRYEYADPSHVVHDEYGLVVGLGAPLRYRLTRDVALIGGRPYTWAFDDDPANFLVDTDDILAVRAQGSAGATLGLPLGLLVQLTGDVAVDVRSGYRRGIGGGPYRGVTWVPFGADLLVNLGGAVDVAASFDLPGDTSAYLARRTFRVWVRFRF